MSSHLSAELRRLENGPMPGEKPAMVGIVRFLVRCPVEASEVLRKAKQALRIADEAALTGWPIKKELAPQLPEWFMSACVKEMSREQAEQWLAWWKKLPPEEQHKVEIEKAWSAEAWLYRMEPVNRQWYWWDAKVLENNDQIAFAIEIDGWPFPWGALRWLFRAAGASAVEEAE